MRVTILVVLLAAVFSVTAACSCPDLTFQQLYRSAATKIKAKALSVKRFPGSASRPVSYLFKIRLLSVFKGCGPRKVFYAKTMLDGGTCSSVLSKGTTYLIQLPSQPDRQEKFPKLFYKFYGCYDVKTWKYVSKQERACLWRQRAKPENKCKV